ncbi:hypothetical protein GCM10011383_23950 [Hymenobacter cavernae]|uniref:Uncharacterized protein n=1 Tax=Hymenobacter cavernae TaxID=2044852 RepID=A0ABQ1U8X8_9BACT|nr:hypothetical protein GCM10011383_23950 [Hymenobacter cavernae]
MLYRSARKAPAEREPADFTLAKNVMAGARAVKAGQEIPSKITSYNKLSIAETAGAVALLIL